MQSARHFCCAFIRQHFFDCVNNFYHLKLSKTDPWTYFLFCVNGEIEDLIFFGGGGAVSRYKALSIATMVHCGRIFLSNVLLIFYVLSFPLLQLQFCCVIVLSINCCDITFFNRWFFYSHSPHGTADPVLWDMKAVLCQTQNSYVGVDSRSASFHFHIAKLPFAVVRAVLACINKSCLRASQTTGNRSFHMFLTIQLA